MEIALNVFLILCMFAMGSLFGSFFSLATYRLPRKQDIMITRSYCPNCKHRLEFFDLIPVLSYLFRGAKCKYCKMKISPRYFLLEISNGTLFVLLYLIFGYNFKLAIVILFYAIIFVLIGANVMKSKMSKEELDEVRDMVEEKKKRKEEKKLNKKSGIVISELIIALILFVFTLVTTIMVNRNSRDKITLSILESKAQNIIQKNIELCMLANYDYLGSTPLNSVSCEYEGIVFTPSVTFNNIYANDNNKDNIVKEISVTVAYDYNGKHYEMNTKTLKGKIKYE